MYERAIGIWEKALGPDHPNLASARLFRIRAELLREQVGAVRNDIIKLV